MAARTHGTPRGTTAGSTTALHLALAWGFVGIPLAWGVIQTLLNALKLFG
jgi:hypothetical protein